MRRSESNADQLRDKAYRRILWIVLIINFVMFLVEVIAGVAAGSVSLQADALDFLADSANYAISLFVVGMALRRRAQAAMVKGITMVLFSALDACAITPNPRGKRGFVA